MKKVVIHRRMEGRKLHPWLFLTACTAGAAILVALVVYVVAGRETPEKKAVRLTRELVESIGELDWEMVRDKMGVPDSVGATDFKSWMVERHKILLDQAPVLASSELGDAEPREGGVYRVKYATRFVFKRTERERRTVHVADWKYDEASDSMSYVIGDETKEALDIE